MLPTAQSGNHFVDAKTVRESQNPFFPPAHAIPSERPVDVPEFSKRLSNVAWMAAITACL
jgi:hypothetical protein